MKTIYLSFGSNLGNREAALHQALASLHRSDLRIQRISSVYETAPRDLLNQPEFLNIVVEANTSLFPMRLLQRTLRIERELGRKRNVAKGPRAIDIDILLYGSFVVSTTQLQIPHPRMLERRFVMEPLAELVPGLMHPVTRRRIRDYLPEVADQRVQKMSLPIALPEAEFKNP